MKKPAKHTVVHTEEAIRHTFIAIKAGVNKHLCRSTLIDHGFAAQKADVIIRWAVQNTIAAS